MEGTGFASVKGQARVVYDFTPNAGPASAVLEPASWAMMVVGFGMAGATLRRHRRSDPAAA